MLLGQQNEAGENKGKSSKFFPFIAKTLRFDSHDSNQTNPTHLKATPTQQKIIEESLKPVGLTMAFELGSPRQIHTETLNKIEPSKFLGQGSFGYVELLEISPLKKSNVSLFEELITEECLKLNGALPENVARKVFDMKKLVTPETDEQWNGMSETKICRNLRGEVYTEICEIEREVNLHNEASESDYVVKFFGWRVCEENKRVMLYMEACQQSLAAILKSGYRFSVSEMRKIAFCVATGLDHIHGLEIVHLDIKPDNLLLANDGRIKICDFGVSTKFNVTPADLRFTPTYVSPELFFINLKLQHLHIEFAQNRTSAKPLYFAKNEVRLFFADGSACKTDIWAFGVTLLELIVGACPFSLYSLREIRDKLASALVLAENEISTSFLDDLFDEAKYLLEEGIGTYPGERESAPRFKYERDIVSFLQRFRDIQDISERNEVRRMLDFVRKTLIVDVEERFGADELLDQKFLAPIDLSDSKESDSLKKLLKTVEKEERRKKSKSTLLRRTKPINLRLLAKSL